MAVAPRKIKLRPTGVDTSAATKTLTIRNLGKTTLGGMVDDSLSAPFSISAGSGTFSVPPRQMHRVTIAFAPAVPGNFSQSFTITSSDSKHGSVTVTVAGKGLPGKLKAARSVRFPSTATAATSTRSLTIRNTGKGMLHGSVGAISGSAEFQLQSGGGAFTLAHGARQTVTIAFTPSAAGKAAASLALSSDDPKHLSAIVHLSGTGK